MRLGIVSSSSSAQCSPRTEDESKCFATSCYFAILYSWTDRVFAQDLGGHDQSALNSTLWAGTAVEHDAAALQAYHQASSCSTELCETARGRPR